MTVYNSIDKSYFKEATNKLNNLFNSEKMEEFQQLQEKRNIPTLKRPMDEIDDETDSEIAMLKKNLAEKKARKKNQDREM